MKKNEHIVLAVGR